MSNCIQCGAPQTCAPVICPRCLARLRGQTPPNDPLTNADRIRAMSDEELAEFIEGQRVCQICRRRMNNCFPGDVFGWLQQPAAEEGEHE